jgi:hypothetical protein
MALGEQGIEMGYCYNRKEKKDVRSLPLENEESGELIKAR